MADLLIIQDKPELIAPYILVGLKGWLNAGEVSTGSIDYLRRKLGARPFASIEPSGFYIYQIPSSPVEQSTRPLVKIKEGLVKKLDLPRNEFFFWKSGAAHDLILFLGVEPNLDWPAYAKAIVDLARQLQVPRIYSLVGDLRSGASHQANEDHGHGQPSTTERRAQNLRTVYRI